MRLLPPRSRPPREPVLPMINVVFLLLIFFLMTARLTPAPPFDLTPPEAGAAPEALLPARVLWLGADGATQFEDLSGEAALAALATGEGPVLIRADARLPAADLARLMRALAALGVVDLRLATELRGMP